MALLGLEGALKHYYNFFRGLEFFEGLLTT
jgi:hypothetical protein